MTILVSCHMLPQCVYNELEKISNDTQIIQAPHVSFSPIDIVLASARTMEYITFIGYKEFTHNSEDTYECRSYYDYKEILSLVSKFGEVKYMIANNVGLRGLVLKPERRPFEIPFATLTKDSIKKLVDDFMELEALREPVLL